jgi:hypothetical protein
MLFAFVPTSVSKRANAGSARVVEPVRGPPAAPAVVAGTDELVLVRAVSSLPPESLSAMISQPLERGNSELDALERRLVLLRSENANSRRCYRAAARDLFR